MLDLILISNILVDLVRCLKQITCTKNIHDHSAELCLPHKSCGELSLQGLNSNLRRYDQEDAHSDIENDCKPLEENLHLEELLVVNQ